MVKEIIHLFLQKFSVLTDDEKKELAAKLKVGQKFFAINELFDIIRPKIHLFYLQKQFPNKLQQILPY